ncbi:hypothetical protein SKAU_G00297460 [Synaphobranchus kaupii]|uniref:Uncharacterized protein n=1 Tax=Synaphobranchus kaupii TaxID=118154 RepID=A0A9Q1IMX6_SYNKA|nr:hypothetical protein SKAU_G00297460 [Synaphobranchus kaupii]
MSRPPLAKALNSSVRFFVFTSRTLPQTRRPPLSSIGPGRQRGIPVCLSLQPGIRSHHQTWQRQTPHVNARHILYKASDEGLLSNIALHLCCGPTAVPQTWLFGARRPHRCAADTVVWRAQRVPPGKGRPSPERLEATTAGAA